jgi:hypothetical protein
MALSPFGWKDKMKNLSRRHLAVVQIVILIFYIFIRVITTIPALNAPRELADTKVYVNISNRPIFSADFLYVDRPFAFPLLLQIVHQNFEMTAAIQLGLTLFAWSLLAFMVSASFQPIGLRLFAFLIILALSLVRHLAGWDFVMMTESFSLSFFILLICSGIWLLQGWRLDRVIALSVVAFIFAFTRDTNAYLLAMVAGMIFLAVILRWVHPRALSLAFIFLAIFFINNLSADLSQRWKFPFINVVGKRILPYTALLQSFESCGMPVTPELLAQAGVFANENNRTFLDDPSLKDFRSWVAEDGKTCYIKWLVANPVTSIGSAFRQFNGLIYFEDVNKYFSRKYTDLLPSRVERLLYPVHGLTWIFAGLTIFALAAVYQKMWLENPLWAMYIMLCLTIFPHLFITWHGDAMAVERHALSVGLQLSITLWLFVFLALEKGAGFIQRS